MSEDLEGHGYVDVWCVLGPNDNPYEMDVIAEEYCNETCGNGHFSQWTNFGQGLYSDCLKFQRRYFEVLNRMGIE